MEQSLQVVSKQGLLRLAAEAVSDAVGTADGTRNSLCRGHTAAVGLFWECSSDCSYDRS